jgi:hypothetical protein
MNKFTGMIKAKYQEGNIVNHYFDGDEFQQVTVVGQVYDRVHIQLPTGGGTDVDIKTIEPIPLTPEWLERYGYIEMEYVYSDGSKTNAFVGKGRRYIIRYFKHIAETPYYGVEHSPYPQSHNCIPGELRYVHQLQNLYYALTGEELTIKEITA